MTQYKLKIANETVYFREGSINCENLVTIVITINGNDIFSTIGVSVEQRNCNDRVAGLNHGPNQRNYCFSYKLLYVIKCTDNMVFKLSLPRAIQCHIVCFSHTTLMTRCPNRIICLYPKAKEIMFNVSETLEKELNHGVKIYFGPDRCEQ